MLTWYDRNTHLEATLEELEEYKRSSKTNGMFKVMNKLPKQAYPTFSKNRGWMNSKNCQISH